MEQESCKAPGKILHPLAMLVANLDQWFVTFKVTAFKGKVPGQGVLNPANGRTLFRPETKVALEEAEKKAQFVADILSLEEIHQPVEALTGAAHSLPRHRCVRGQQNQSLSCSMLTKQCLDSFAKSIMLALRDTTLGFSGGLGLICHSVQQET
jgi:hypothetical protein